MANCKKCGAPIVWVKTDNSVVPCDIKLIPYRQTSEGTRLLIREDGVAVHGVIDETSDTFARESHFASCPFAKEFRGKRNDASATSRQAKTPQESKRVTRYRHGDSYTRLYGIWKKMRRRCNASTCKDWKDYGAKGIRVCEEWDDWETFKAWALSHDYNDDLSIDRIDPKGNYCPENCRWADKFTQARNRTTSRFVTYNGETHVLAEWEEILGIKKGYLWSYLRNHNNDMGRAIDFYCAKREVM